jgi:hypothetical protein
MSKPNLVDSSSVVLVSGGAAASQQSVSSNWQKRAQCKFICWADQPLSSCLIMLAMGIKKHDLKRLIMEDLLASGRKAPPR